MNIIEYLDDIDRRMVTGRVAAIEQGLCLSCGKPTGAPEGWFMLRCEPCKESRPITFFRTQPT